MEITEEDVQTLDDALSLVREVEEEASKRESLNEGNLRILDVQLETLRDVFKHIANHGGEL